MSLTYQHGTRIARVPDGVLSFEIFDQATFAILGTAPDADAAKFPLNEPIGLTGEVAQIEALGVAGTLKDAILSTVLTSGGNFLPRTAIVRIAEGADVETTLANAIGSASSATGWHAFRHCATELGFKPKTYLAPGLTPHRPGNAANPLVAEMTPWLERQRAMILAGGPSKTKEDAFAYREEIGSMSVEIIDPRVTVFDAETATTIVQPAEAYVAGLGARIIRDGDAETRKPPGFWVSWSNAEIGVITGTERPISFDYSDPDTESHLLNENEINTIVRDQGWRYWGGLTAASDPSWKFANVVRTRYAIEEMAARDFAPIIDAPMSAPVVVDALVSFNDKIQELKNAGAIIGGRAFFLKNQNSNGSMRQGNLRVEFDAEETPPIHSLTIGSRRNIRYFDVLVDDIVRNLASPA